MQRRRLACFFIVAVGGLLASAQLAAAQEDTTYPTLLVTNVPDVASLPEGGVVTYTVTVTNTSGASDPFTLTGLVDDLHGDLNGQGDCALPQDIAPGANYACDFDVLVSGVPGERQSNGVTAAGVDDDEYPVSAVAYATVDVIDTAPTLAVTLAPDVSLAEPGSEVEFEVTVTNTSGASDPVNLTNLSDSRVGEVACRTGGGLPQTIAPGESYLCLYDRLVAGNAGEAGTDTVTAEASDDEGNPVRAAASATFEFTDTTPALFLEVSSPSSGGNVPAPGGTVRFLVLVKNISVSSDPVTITSLTDVLLGDLNGLGDCRLPITIPPNPPEGGLYPCGFESTIVGAAGETYALTVTVTGSDDEGNPVSAVGGTTIHIT